LHILENSWGINFAIDNDLLSLATILVRVNNRPQAIMSAITVVSKSSDDDLLYLTCLFSLPRGLPMFGLGQRIIL